MNLSKQGDLLGVKIVVGFELSMPILLNSSMLGHALPKDAEMARGIPYQSTTVVITYFIYPFWSPQGNNNYV